MDFQKESIRQHRYTPTEIPQDLLKVSWDTIGQITTMGHVGSFRSARICDFDRDAIYTSQQITMDPGYPGDYSWPTRHVRHRRLAFLLRSFQTGDCFLFGVTPGVESLPAVLMPN